MTTDMSDLPARVKLVGIRRVESLVLFSQNGHHRLGMVVLDFLELVLELGLDFIDRFGIRLGPFIIVTFSQVADIDDLLIGTENFEFGQNLGSLVFQGIGNRITVHAVWR